MSWERHFPSKRHSCQRRTAVACSFATKLKVGAFPTDVTRKIISSTRRTLRRAVQSTTFSFLTTMIPSVILEHLTKLRPGAEFTGSPPRVKSSDGGVFFVKVGSASEAEQFAGEAESLNAIDAAAPGLAPHVYASGQDEAGRPYFVSDYLDFGPLTDKAGAELAKRMALEMHQYTSEQGFGFHVPTYCGATRMKNGWYPTWQECYGEMVNGLLNDLRSQGGRYSGLCSKGDKVVSG